MPLDPDIASLLARAKESGAPALEQMTVEQARAAAQGLPRMQRPPEPVASIAAFEVRSADGSSIPLRVYRPHVDTTAPLPMLVYAHGGGWIRGTLDQYDGPYRAIANAGRCLVLAVDYRLAPEHRYPLALHDVYAALEWAAEHASDLGGDASRLALGGDSSGGNLAAAGALMARERGGPQLAHLLLFWPPLDHGCSAASYREFAIGYMLSTAAMRMCWDYYLPDPQAGNEPYASPLRAHDLSRLPQTTVITAEYDPLRDDGETFAARLAAAGVTTRLVRLPGMIHAALHMDGIAPAAHRAVDEAGAALRDAFARN